MVRLSTVAVSTFVPALKVRSTTLPDRTFFSVVRTNAPPLPGLTCWNSTTVQGSPSRLSTRPFFRSLVVAMRVTVSSRYGSSRCESLNEAANSPRKCTGADGLPLVGTRSVGLLQRLLAGLLLVDRVGRRLRGEVTQREVVAVDAQPADHAGGHGRDHRVVPELLARVDVRDVHLDERPTQQRARVAQRVRVVRPGARIQHDGGTLVGRVVQP